MKLLRLPAVKTMRGESRSTIYVRVRQRLLTRPIPLSARAVAWPESEIVVLNAARVAGKTDEEIKAIVASLEAARSSALSDVNAFIASPVAARDTAPDRRSAK